jgi:hypothetical protein
VALFRSQASSVAPAFADERYTNSPSFDLLTRNMSADRKYQILDLGPARTETLEFFSQFSCKLFVADALDPLARLGGVEDEEQVGIAYRLRDLFPYADGERFDLIMSWDILNYLDRPIFRKVMEYLACFTHSGTYLHAFVSSLRHMPANPSRYRLIEGNRMLREIPDPSQRACPQYPQRELERLMPQFAVEHSVLLKSGIQEYLFCAR